MRLRYFPGDPMEAAVASVLVQPGSLYIPRRKRRVRNPLKVGAADSTTPVAIDRHNDRYLHMLDGGLSDNLGLLAFIRAYRSGFIRSIERLLERVALSTSEGVEADPNRVSLLTVHSTKGLEFSRVYIVGVEDYTFPGYQATERHIQPEIEEARRLLYVAMTRARDRLVLTRAEVRNGKPSGGERFLEEIGVGERRLVAGS